MDFDLMFVIGVILSGLAIPSILSAYSDNRAPRAAAIVLLIGGVLLVAAITKKPGGVAFGQVPDIFFRVIARYIN